MQATASGLLSLQAELRKRKQRDAGAAAAADDAAQGAPSAPGSEYSNADAHKRKKLSADFVMPKEGINRPSSSAATSGSKRGAKDILDKYNVKGRGPNVSLLSKNAKTPSAQLEAERQRILKAKSRAYDELIKQGGTLDDDDTYNEDGPGSSGALIDFRRKAAEQADLNPSDANADSRPFFEDDGYGEEQEEQITYIDDLGRTRTAPRSQVPEHLLDQNNNDRTSDNAQYGRQTSFPVYRPPSPKLRVSRAIRKKIESGEPPLQHFDPRAEVRNRGAGLFQFSQDETERSRQMEALQRERARTERERRARFGGPQDAPGPVPREGFVPAEDRPWGGEDDDYEEGGIAISSAGRQNGDDDPADGSASASSSAAPAATFDPFAAVEMAARAAESAGKGKKHKDRPR